MKQEEYNRLLRACRTEREREYVYAAAGNKTQRAAAARLRIDPSTLSKALKDIASRVDTPEPPEEKDPLTKHREKQDAKAEKKVADSLVSQLAALKDRVALFDDLSGAPLSPVTRRELSSGAREATAVALLSDWHVETLVRPTDTPTGNAFTLAIADLRISRAFEGILWLTRSAQENFKIRTLILWLGGDFITNHLHPENVETAQLGPAPALLWVQSRIIAGVRRLLDSGAYDQLLIPCSYGNHGRTTDRMRSGTSADHSWEWVMYQAIAYHFRDEPRVSVLADEAAHQYANVYGHELHFHHGHDVKYGGGVGGIMIPINKAVAGWDSVRRCAVHHFGHFHQYLSVGSVVVNGSLIGYDSYAMSIKARPEPPRQAFYVFDSKRGPTLQSPIWVNNPDEEIKIWKGNANAYRK